MQGEHGLSHTHEMYLKVLYRLELDGEVGRVRDMAKGLGVTPGTVSAVLKKLERAGLVLHDRYGFVKLTPAGTRVGRCVLRRFETVKGLLEDVLGLDAEAAEVDACTIEHAVSPATINRMELLVELVRRGDIVVKPMNHIERSGSTCAECEASGVCRAAAAVAPFASRHNRN